MAVSESRAGTWRGEKAEQPSHARGVHAHLAVSITRTCENDIFLLCRVQGQLEDEELSVHYFSAVFRDIYVRALKMQESRPRVGQQEQGDSEAGDAAGSSVPVQPQEGVSVGEGGASGLQNSSNSF